MGGGITALVSLCSSSGLGVVAGIFVLLFIFVSVSFFMLSNWLSTGTSGAFLSVIG
jgi:hypothetical protein